MQRFWDQIKNSNYWVLMKYSIVTKEVSEYDVVYVLQNGAEIKSIVSDIYVDAYLDRPEEFKSAYLVAFVRYYGKNSIADANGVYHLIVGNPVIDHKLTYRGKKIVRVRTLAKEDPTWWEKVKNKLGL
jgi:hypothetical protein